MTNTHFNIPNYLYSEMRIIYSNKLFNEIGASRILQEIKKDTNVSVDNVQLRLLPEVNIGIAIADDYERGALVCPRNDDASPDYSGMFIIEDKNGMEYLKDIWNYYWNISEPTVLE